MTPLPAQRTWTLFAAVIGLMLAAGCGSAAWTTETPDDDNPNVVASYDGEELTLDEFERQYARSSGVEVSAAEDSLAAYREFLDRYVNFRLKVLAAHEAGLPQKPAVRDEIESYRTRLARPFLLDRQVLDPIIRDIYDRQQQLVDVSHILVRLTPGASAADTLAAFRELQAVRDSLLQGGDFADLALRHSEDPSASGDPGERGYGGRLGYFTGGNLVEPFETFAYETPIGEISPVFRTQFGYHVLQVNDRRPAMGNIRVSHIMLRPEPTPRDSTEVMETLDELKARLADGADFSSVAQEYSQDAQSKPRGGDLGLLAFTAPVHESFKNAAFDLETVGDVSDVVETPYGFHLIKLTDRQELPTFDEAYDEIKQLVGRLPRTRTAEEDFARNIASARGARIDTALVLDAFSAVPVDSVIAAFKNERLGADVLADTFFVVGDTAFTVGDLAAAAEPSSMGAAQTTDARVKNLVSSFVTQRIIDLEAERLEDRNEEFARLMQEFRDGLVLFELMEDSVWTVAERDSAALKTYFEERSDSYRWPERTRVITLESRSDAALMAALTRLDSGMSLSELAGRFAADSVDAVRFDTTMIADSTNAIYDRALSMESGEHSSVLPYRGGYVVVMNDGVEAPRPKTFEEARATVVGDYQDVVEQRLIERLRIRYDAQLYPDRLARAFDDVERSAEASPTAADH